MVDARSDDDARPMLFFTLTHHDACLSPRASPQWIKVWSGKAYPLVAFFCNRNIPAGTELTWNYDTSVGGYGLIRLACVSSLAPPCAPLNSTPNGR